MEKTKARSLLDLMEGGRIQIGKGLSAAEKSREVALKRDEEKTTATW
jgi:hypothetical protein